ELIAQGMRSMPLRGALTLTVPGLPDAWEQLLLRSGTWTLAQALEPAIEYARNGFPVTDRLASAISANAAVLASCPAAAAAFLPGGRPPHPGSRMMQPRLADTLEQMAQSGACAFYRGPIAAALAQYVDALGGWLAIEDLTAHTSEWVEPLATRYRDLTVLE